MSTIWPSWSNGSICADHAGGPRLGRGDRHGRGAGLAASGLPLRAVQYRGVSLDVDMPWRIRVCRTPAVGTAGRARAERVCPGRIAHGRLQHPERMTPAVRAGYLAPYDSWQHRQAIYRFVQDIPMSPQHPSYATLTADRAGTAAVGASTMAARSGACAIGASRRQFLERFLEFFPQAEVHRLDDAGHYVVEDAHERIVPLVEAVLRRASAGRGRMRG